MMQRRSFLGAMAATAVSAPAAMPARIGMGYNTYCLRALRMTDRQHLEQAAAWKLDSLFLQDSLDPAAMDPKHWSEVRSWAKDLGIHMETGGSGLLPKTPEQWDSNLAAIRRNIERAKAIGSPIVRGVCASFRSDFAPGTMEEKMELAVKVLKAVKAQVVDAGLKFAIEVHKDFQAWEHKLIIEEAGKDFVGTYLDTGNPVFVMEDPMLTLETLAPYVLTFHLRDSVVYEHPDGIAVQWVPLGEGTVDFKAIIAKARQILNPGVNIYIKPITGRPPVVLPVYGEKLWREYFPKARANEFARFVALAKKGRPYEKNSVIEDVAGRKTPEPYAAALAYQQKEHMERSIGYARTVLQLGIKAQA